MYSKVVIFMCVASLASAGELLQAAAPVAYSSQSFSSHISHAPITTHEAASTYSSYNTPSYTAYVTAPVVTKSYAPSVSYQSISTPVAYAKTYAAPAYNTYAAPAYNTYATAPVATYSAPVYAKSTAPAVSSLSSISTHSSPVTYAATSPIVTKTYAAPAYATTYSAPFVGKAFSPAVSYSSYSTHSEPIAYAASPVIAKSYAAPAIATYSSVPVFKSAVTYSAAPAVSYDSAEAKYGW